MKTETLSQPSPGEAWLLTQFLGAVKTREADVRASFWSRFVSAGFIAEDIEHVWPEDNMRFFSMRYSGHTQSFQLRDLNRRELEELLKWLEAKRGRCPNLTLTS